MTRPADPPPHDLLFVYGTLRRGCSTEWARRLADESGWLGEARVRGRLYRAGDYPALATGAADSGTVTGDLVRLRDPAATLAWLDAYEETGPAFPEPWEYRRIIAVAQREGGEYEAWTYVYNWPVTGLHPLPGGDWRNE